VAYDLARRGVAVSLVDMAQPASGATGSSFAWIGDNGSGPAAVLHHGALRDYRRLEAGLAGVQVRWTGSLSWSDGPPKPGAPGSSPEPGFCISAAKISALEPRLQRPPQQAIYAPGDWRSTRLPRRKPCYRRRAITGPRPCRPLSLGCGPAAGG
jgi:glycine/D-amino acid oxidase-like deaminating enzyme